MVVAAQDLLVPVAKLTGDLVVDTQRRGPDQAFDPLQVHGLHNRLGGLLDLPSQACVDDVHPLDDVANIIQVRRIPDDLPLLLQVGTQLIRVT